MAGCTDCMGGYSNYVWLGVLTVWLGTVIMYGRVYGYSNYVLVGVLCIYGYSNYVWVGVLTVLVQ